jgi:hypothetical protein
VLCNENGIGGGCEYCGENDAQPGQINVFYHEASGGKYVPRAVLIDFERFATGALALSCRSANSSARVKIVNQTRARATTGLRPTT